MIPKSLTKELEREQAEVVEIERTQSHSFRTEVSWLQSHLLYLIQNY